MRRLGWKEETDVILDSLMHYREYRQTFFVPEVLGSMEELGISADTYRS
jgi:hypothetical protein